MTALVVIRAPMVIRFRSLRGRLCVELGDVPWLQETDPPNFDAL